MKALAKTTQRIALILLAPSLAWSMPPTAQMTFCQESQNPDAAKEKLITLDYRIAFRNHGGLLNGGVCWWRSRLQRSAVYLALFRPELPRVENPKQVWKLIDRLARGKKVVEIPGYSSFYDFTRDWERLIQKYFERWQLIDGLLKQEWIIGLHGKRSTTPKYLKKTMDHLYQYVEVQKKIAFARLKLTGLTAHSWLIFEVKKLSDGYQVFFLDSNFVDSPYQEFTYRYGDRSIEYKNLRTVPTVQRDQELINHQRAIASYCKNYL